MYENYSVLFVDDEINILNSLRRGLMDEEYTCYFATSGKEALEIMSKQKIAVIVTDMRMPEMDGLTLLKKVYEQWPKTVKIILSGYTQLQQILVTINQVDVFKFITKPWKLEEEFKDVIYKALDYYILQEQNENYKKALESKNQVYQNILKKIDTIIASSKVKNENFGHFGRELMDYGNNFSLEKTEKNNSIFLLKGTIFELISKAVISDKKDILIEDFTNKLIELLENDIMKVQVVPSAKGNISLNLNFEIIKSVIQVCLSVFSTEFLAFGLVFKLDSDDNNLIINLISPNIQSNDDFTEVLNNKLTFINQIMKDFLHSYDFVFNAEFKNSNLIISINSLNF